VVVPIGPLFEVERGRVGHVHGYSQAEVDAKLIRAGFRILKSMAWGFPFYNLYRRVLHLLPKQYPVGQFSSGKIIISWVLYYALFLNLPFWGERYFVLAEVEN
jgi:hypothetical protein